MIDPAVNRRRMASSRKGARSRRVFVERHEARSVPRDTQTIELSIYGAAKRLGILEATISAAYHAGRISGRPEGRRILVNLDELKAFLASREDRELAARRGNMAKARAARWPRGAA